MNFAFVYIVQRFFYRFLDFFHHWYVDGSRVIGNQLMLTLEAADQAFAIKITMRHFFEPLYKDYTAIGRVLGVIFRTGRILAGGLVYLLIGLAFLAVYVVWFGIPAVLLWYIVTGIFISF